MKSKQARFDYRKARVRRRLKPFDASRPRLSVCRSLKYIYAQVIDDVRGCTLATASSLSPELRGKIPSGNKVEAASHVGALIAKKAIDAGVKKQVAFDRGGRLYHGRIKALAEAARSGGLEF